MPLVYNDIKEAVHGLQPSQAMEVAQIAQLAVVDLTTDTTARGQGVLGTQRDAAGVVRMAATSQAVLDAVVKVSSSLTTAIAARKSIVVVSGLTVTNGPSTTANETSEYAALVAALPYGLEFKNANLVVNGVTTSDTMIAGAARYITPLGVFQAFSGTGGGTIGLGCNIHTYATNEPGTPATYLDGWFESIIDSDDFAIVWKGSLANGAGLLGAVLVDGKPLTTDYYTTPASTGGVRYAWVHIQGAKGSTISWMGNMWLYEVRTKNNYDTIRPAVHRLKRMAFFADSFGASTQVSPESGVAYGTNATYTKGILQMTGIAATASRVLGLTLPVINCASGTGFMASFNTNGQIYGNYLDRVTNAEYDPTVRVVVFHGTGNDPANVTFTDGEYVARILDCVVMARTKYPNAIICVSDVLAWQGWASFAAYITRLSPLIQQACTQSGALFLRTNSTSRSDAGVLTGTGSRFNVLTGANAGNSNTYLGWVGGSDSHPNSFGKEHIGLWLADLIASTS